MTRAIELFAGAGGAALGLAAAGIEHAALVEWDASACATLRAAGLGPVVEGDVRDLDRIAAVAGEPIHLLWSSFPCQAWSAAGRRLGANDPRNGWPWTVNAIDRFRPAWFLAENVAGLTHHRGDCAYRGGQEGLFGSCDLTLCPGCYLERVILPDLRRRFALVGMWLLDAADYGVPQHRRRLILWGGPVALGAPPLTHGPGRRPWVSMGEALGLRCEVAGTDHTGRPAPTVATNWGRDGEKARRATRVIERPAPAVTCTEVKGTRASDASGGTFHGGPDRASDALYLATGRRRLTVAECAILQGFPTDYPWQGTSEARYRQVGNAVPPRLAEVVGRALMAARAAG